MATIQALRLIKALARLGWSVDRVAGSHHVLTRPGHGHVTVLGTMASMSPQIAVDRSAIADFCKRHGGSSASRRALESALASER